MLSTEELKARFKLRMQQLRARRSVIPLRQQASLYRSAGRRGFPAVPERAKVTSVIRAICAAHLVMGLPPSEQDPIQMIKAAKLIREEFPQAQFTNQEALAGTHLIVADLLFSSLMCRD